MWLYTGSETLQSFRYMITHLHPRYQVLTLVKLCKATLFFSAFLLFIY